MSTAAASVAMATTAALRANGAKASLLQPVLRRRHLAARGTTTPCCEVHVSLYRVVAPAALLQIGGSDDDRRCSKGGRYIVRIAMEQRRVAESIAGATVELGRSCNGASSELSVMRWSFIEAAMELVRSCNGASMEPLVVRWSLDGVAMKLHWSRQCCIGAPTGLQ